MSAQTRRLVLEMYREVDRAVAAAGPVCVASGRCCRFKEYGHTLFLSNLEAEVLLDAAPPYDRDAVTADFCPFQKENLCTAREPRPLGCRVYYCDPNYQETGDAISRKVRQAPEGAGRRSRRSPGIMPRCITSSASPKTPPAV